MDEQRVDGVLVALNDAEDAVRQPGLGQQLRQQQRRRRDRLSRLRQRRAALHGDLGGR